MRFIDFINESQSNVNYQEIDSTQFNIIRQSFDRNKLISLVNKEYIDKLSNLKDEMRELYKNTKEEALKKYDYDIFMAIAEDIGYDAIGKETGKNELEYITKELKKFIESL
jgi:type I restriction enzyme M protein